MPPAGLQGVGGREVSRMRRGWSLPLTDSQFRARKCESSLGLILTATLLGNYLSLLIAEGETKALPGFKVFAVSCTCDVPCMEGRMQLQSLEEAVRLDGENLVERTLCLAPNTCLREIHLMLECLSLVNG